MNKNVSTINTIPEINEWNKSKFEKVSFLFLYTR